MSEKDVKNEEVKKVVVEDVVPSPTPEEEAYDSIVGNKETKIPYSRFKEVNDAKKAAETKAAGLEAEISTRVEEAVRNKLMDKQLLAQSTEDEYSYLTEPEDVTKKEIAELKETVKELSKHIQGVSNYTEENILKQELKSLKIAFPALNVEHVLSIKKMSPDTPLEELAKHSNDMFKKHAKDVFQQMINEKKSNAEKAKVMGPERIKAMKPEDKPKTMKDAQAAMMRFVNEE